jgi:hypothetical protein
LFTSEGGWIAPDLACRNCTYAFTGGLVGQVAESPPRFRPDIHRHQRQLGSYGAHQYEAGHAWLFPTVWDGSQISGPGRIPDVLTGQSGALGEQARCAGTFGPAGEPVFIHFLFTCSSGRLRLNEVISSRKHLRSSEPGRGFWEDCR